jgi:Ankyrin repeat.
MFNKVNFCVGSDYINEKTEEGETPLLLACLQNNDVEVVRLLMEHDAEINLPNNENLGPLHAGISDLNK